MNVKISGRHVNKDEGVYLSFSGSYIEFELTGKRSTAEIKTDKAYDKDLMGFAGVFINGSFKKKIKLDKPIAEYVLYDSEKEEKVTIRLMRFSENNFGKMCITNIKYDGYISPTTDKAFKIEFIGDSITCGYGVEAESENDTFCTKTENPAKAYAVMTAEALNADFQLVCWSGNGLLTQWIPPERDEPDLSVPLMPDIYTYEDYGGYLFEGYKEPRKFDFTTFKPDVVVINLGTNDASYTRGIKSRVDEFGKAYVRFIELVRKYRPNAKIIGCLGIMNDDLCDELEKRIGELRVNDPNLFFVRQTPIREDEAYGADWHPGEAAQKRIAKQLKETIERIV